MVAHLKALIPKATWRCTNQPSLCVLTCGRSRAGDPAMASMVCKFRSIASIPSSSEGDGTADKSAARAHAISKIIVGDVRRAAQTIQHFRLPPEEWFDMPRRFGRLGPGGHREKFTHCRQRVRGAVQAA